MNIIQQKIRTFRITDRLLDFILLFLSARGAIVLERIYHSKSWHALDPQSFNFYSLIIIFSVWLVLIQIFEHDLVYRQTSIWKVIQNTSFMTFIGVTTTITLDFLFSTDLFKRSTIIYFGFLSYFFLLLKRSWMKHFLSSIRQDGLDPKNILIVGSKKRAERLIHEIQNHKEYGLKICAILDPDPKQVGQEIDNLIVTGDMTLFKRDVRDLEIDEVFFAMDMNFIPNIQELFSYLDIIGINYHMMINESVHSYSEKFLEVEPVTVSYYGLPMLSFRSVTAGYMKLYLKNGIEKIFSSILLFFSIPIFILFSILIKCTSKGPIFYNQERVGLRGRKFRLLKLRSMIVNADRMKDKFSHLNEQTGPVFKIKNDPRLTKVGKFMRKYSIDELPQLFNILSGNMSLIGPRPLLVSEVKLFDNDILHRRHSMKPGVTGLWQVSGRNEVKDFHQWVKLDLEYIDNWSFGLDFKIAMKTVGTIFSGTGM